ncbi:MAG: hypothetical protein LBB36_00115, partial [Fibromonadaceae bacterium]|nr:hypothetical protein [Fibromonadaceae bacterium]
MKKNLFTLEILMFTLVFTFLAGCSNSDDDTGNGGTIGGSTLAERLQTLKTNAVSNTEYHFELTSNESMEAQGLYYGKDNITIRLTSSSGEKTISLIGDGKLFTIGGGVTLILGNGVTLVGRSSNSSSLVEVNGTLIMNEGAKITGNTNIKNGTSAAGVFVSYGIFTMKGGEITDNTVTDGSGGGVFMNGGTFTMEGGKISGNTARESGGVEVYSGTFTMKGGEISRNAARSNAGGVGGALGTFMMEGGEISSNTAANSCGGVNARNASFTMEGGKISGNTAANGDGGGVCAPTFVITDGEISNNTATGNGGGVHASSSFTMTGGEISGNTASSGGGVWYRGYGTFAKIGGTIYGSENESNSNRNLATEGLGNAV